MYTLRTPVALVSPSVATRAANSRHSNYVQCVCSALIAGMLMGKGHHNRLKSLVEPSQPSCGNTCVIPHTHAYIHQYSHRWKVKSPVYCLTPWDLPIRTWCHQRTLERAVAFCPPLCLLWLSPGAAYWPVPLLCHLERERGPLWWDITLRRPLLYRDTW